MSDAARLDHLRGLISIPAALRAGGDLKDVLAAIAHTVADALGIRTVAVSLERPAWDDFEVVAVHGLEHGGSLLLGRTTVREDWAAVLDDGRERHGAYLVEDAVVVPLRGASGSVLGLLSAKGFVAGRPPDDVELAVLAAMCTHAALAVEQARAAAAARRHRAAMEHLLRVSAGLTGGGDVDDMLESVCAGIRDALGFHKVSVFLAEGPRGRLAQRASVGFSLAELARFPILALETIAPVLAPALEQEGCVLVDETTGHALTRAALREVYPSRRNGRGPRAWDHHWLVVALRDRDGQLIGFLSADDPEDRRLPETETLRALRAFANQAMGALESARQLQEMRHLAEHDPLTGLRNRRTFDSGLEAAVAAAADGAGSASLLVCDLDHFKQINDSLGHEAGDEVLRRFGRLLRAGIRSSDLPTRLGGEEFAVVLPGFDAQAALQVAERLRLTLRADFADFPERVSVSVGVAALGPAIRTPAELVRAGYRALYTAKYLGRDRCLVYEADTLELLSSLRQGDDATREQLAAAVLLAETLDLRDLGTASHSRTVARYAEQIAHALGWPSERVERVRSAGLLHDVGKLGIADAILHKSDSLNAHELSELRRHPELGARILEHANLRDIGAWVLAHHERVDGGGYPYGLRSDDIPIEARVLAVADAYEAMTTERPYRVALPAEAARQELRSGAGAQFDAGVVDAFLGTLADDPRGGAAEPASSLSA